MFLERAKHEPQAGFAAGSNEQLVVMHYFVMVELYHFFRRHNGFYILTFTKFDSQLVQFFYREE